MTIIEKANLLGGLLPNWLDFYILFEFSSFKLE